QPNTKFEGGRRWINRDVIGSRSPEPRNATTTAGSSPPQPPAMLPSSVSYLQSPNLKMFLTPISAPSLPSLFFSSLSRSTTTTTFLLPLYSIRDSLPSSVSCSASRYPIQGRGRGRGPGNTVDYEGKPLSNWNEIYKRISFVKGTEIGVAGAFEQFEREGKTFVKWELCRVVRELRKFRNYKLALEVYEWMRNRKERFSLFSSDMAIQLDLIAKVRGLSSAEEFFNSIPDMQKDNRVYGALLNAYVGAKVRDKAEQLMDTMRKKGYASEPLAYNVMMTLYMKLKEYEKVDSIVSELKQKNIPLDIYTYNIWLSACGSKGSVDAVEEVFEALKQDESVTPTWSTYGTMATLYIRLGQPEKAEQCLKGLESRIFGRNRLPFHYLINLYGSLGNKTEVHRVWSVYKSMFLTVTNWGYHAIISSLVKVGDVEGAEKIYEEWLNVRTSHDTRITNILLTWYVNDGLYEKAELFFNRLGETGGNPIASTWDILATCYIKQRRISDALNCFRKAACAEGSDKWKPRLINVSLFFELCEQEGDMTSKEDMVVMLRKLESSMDEVYRSVVSEYSGTDFGDNGKRLKSDYESDNGDGNADNENEDSEMLFSVSE
ncbi:hypothetical protein V2J09_018959, partial [Rumex salicifolius]